jgi:hypothetical protein
MNSEAASCDPRTDIDRTMLTKGWNARKLVNGFLSWLVFLIVEY